MRYESRQASQQNAQLRGQVAKDISIEPPIGGWNTRDALDNVPPQDALVLDNFTCGLGSIQVRKGSAAHSYSSNATDAATTGTHTPGVVQTLAKYDGGGDPQLVAADGGALWIATDPGSKTSVEADGYASDIWGWTNFRGQGDDALLILVNGTDAVEFDGTTFSTLTPPLTDGLIVPLSPIPIGCTTFKNRVYYWQAGSQSVWYTELYAASGQVTEFPLGDVGSFGGHIVAIESWTHDGGHGTDDYILFIMSSGEVLAYQGSHPESEADWALVGIYNVGIPMGPRSFVKFGGDLFMMTDLDIVPMSQVIAGLEQNRNLTKISGAMQRIAAYRGTFGFQATVFPPSKLLIFNVPGDDVGTYYQFVMNTVTGAWSRWTDRAAQSACWIEFNGGLYYGSSEGVVYEAEVGFLDYYPTFEDVRGPGESVPLVAETILPYVAGNPTFSGQADLEGGFPTPDYPAEYQVEANVQTADGQSATAVWFSLTVGTRFTLHYPNGELADTVLEVVETAVFTVANRRIMLWVDWISGPTDPTTDGREIEYIVGGSEPPPEPPDPGDEVTFVSQAIRSQVQTAWLRFGVEENKQFDAVKMFFSSGASVPHNMVFATDYKEFPAIDYPTPIPALSVPWSAEYLVPLEPVVVPDPTTWWTDEGSNPPYPENEVTGENSIGAVTKWAQVVTTTEQWEMINGYGRAISMLMKLTTEEQTIWNLAFWHLKLGSRM